MIKKTAALLLTLMLLALAPAQASNFYLIPDSNTRYLTEEELWEWQYDALAYCLNEIFARHGFTFDADGRFYPWFNRMTWYRAEPKLTKSACYDRLSKLEWDNEVLIKKVRADMRALGTRNEGGKTLPSIEPDLLNIPNIFEEYLFTPNQRIPVYSGPGTYYLRGANGKAMTSTNGTVYVGGVENGWVLLLYRTNKGAARMGYGPAESIKDTVYASMPPIQPQAARISYGCPITDDPVSAGAPLAYLNAGDTVTYLFPLYNDRNWAYVEAQTANGLLRGCVPLDAISPL